MRVIVEYDKCVASGACVVAASEVFDQKEDDGSVILLQENPSEEMRPAVEEAVAACPAACLHIES